MPKYVIERDVENAGDLSADDLRNISIKSCDVLEQLGPKIQWVESFVTPSKIYCVYIAPDEAMIRKHAEMGEFPITSISEVGCVIDPTTSEGP
ncbi:DUF4242 domain-containing protein [Oceanimonas baumannii]|uniref:DUF4242 domain-containing protein n=1 Tax=Oceanimonas baumannii TaxID=129578 RepID=UPI001D180B97|nr:DUF4242 domain-containing protein [Oceanimonas baumannii]MCC4263900.1 DUF4242 domain-containing protein [Oceanimonas baumannii]